MEVRFWEFVILDDFGMRSTLKTNIFQKKRKEASSTASPPGFTPWTLCSQYSRGFLNLLFALPLSADQLNMDFVHKCDSCFKISLFVVTFFT